MIGTKFDFSVPVLLLALSTSPANATPPLDTPLNVNVQVAKVGERQITREDIIHMIQIEKFYKSPELSEADALFIVMQDAIAHEVAHSVGVDVSTSETPVNSPFVDQFTPWEAENKKSQGTLPAHEQTFHVDHGSYAQLYVIPKIIDRKLRRYYSNSTHIHRNVRARIEQALNLAISGKSFAEAASATGLMTAQHEFENKEIEMPATQKHKSRVDPHIPKTVTLLDILNQLTPGSIHPKIIEGENDYRVVRLIAHTGQKYIIETIEAVKPQFETWLKERSRALPITISDDALKRDLKRDYPVADWVERL